MNAIIIHDDAMISGGAQKVAISEAIELAKRGINVIYYSAVGPINEALLASGVKTICLMQDELKYSLNGVISVIKGACRGLFNQKAYNCLKKLLRQYSPENTVVHVHGWSLALSPSIFKAIYKAGFKVLLTCHDYEINCPTRAYFNYKKRKICPKKGMSVSCVFTNCDIRSFWQKIYRVIRESVFYRYINKCDISLIYLSEFNKEIVLRDLKRKCNGYIVSNLVDIPPIMRVDTSKNKEFLFIGRLSPEKGCDLFCEAVTKANVVGGVIGSGKEFDRLHSKYPNISFYGWKTADEMREIIKNARCYIMSSICYEGAPLTVPEIQCAYGLPCIVPEPSGATGYVKDSINGFVYKSGNLDELIKCIDKMKDDNVIDNMTQNIIKNDCSYLYSSETHIENLLNVYNTVLFGEKI